MPEKVAKTTPKDDDSKRLFCGLDISTQNIGIAILDKDNKIVHSSCLMFKPKKKVMPSLEERAETFYKEFQELCQKNGEFERVCLEAPLMMFGQGGSTAKTMASLQRFHGMISLAVRLATGTTPELVDVRHARKLAKITFPDLRSTPKPARKRYTKGRVIEWAETSYEGFEAFQTRNGNPARGEDDRADALVQAYYAAFGG